LNEGTRRDAFKANRSVSVEIGKLGLIVHFERNETIHTEICENSAGKSAEECAQAGLEIEMFTDSRVVSSSTCPNIIKTQVISSIRIDS